MSTPLLYHVLCLCQAVLLVALSLGQVVGKPAVCQEWLLLLLFISCLFVLIHAVVLKARDLAQ